MADQPIYRLLANIGLVRPVPIQNISGYQFELNIRQLDQFAAADERRDQMGAACADEDEARHM